MGFARNHPITIVLSIVTILSIWGNNNNNKVTGFPNVYEISSCLCNNQAYDPNTDSYTFNVNLTLTDLVAKVPKAQNYNHYNYSPHPPTCFGHATCNTAVEEQDCWTCLDIAAFKLVRLCPNRVGAQLAFPDCTIRSPKAQYYDYDDESPHSPPTCCGHVPCNTFLKQEDCEFCLLLAIDRLVQLCLDRIRAQLEFCNCSIG